MDTKVLDQKIRYRDIELETEPINCCPGCDGDNFELYVGIDWNDIGDKIPFEYMRCNDCDLVFQSKRMKNPNQYYQSYYRKLLRVPIEDELISEWLRAERTSTFLMRSIVSMDKCLDVGCSAGYLLQMMKDIYGCEVTGVELSEEYSNYAQEHLGLTVVPTIYDLSDKYDLITMVHILEHINDPYPYLLRIKELLADDGLLYIQVPSLVGSFQKAFRFHHPLVFSEKGLINLLERAGFWLYSNTIPMDVLSMFFGVDNEK